MSRIEAVLFDLGNVLAFHDNDLLLRRFGERAGMSAIEAASRFEPSFWVEINRGLHGPERLHLEVGRRLGIALSAAEFFELWNCHFTINQAILPWVEALGGKVKRLLLSNTNELHARFLKERLPVLAHFDALLLSHELGWVKPEEAIYRAALAAAGTAPEATAFFDDIPEYVEAARQLGIRAQLFKDTADFPGQLQALGIALQGR